jgi:predicted  nucleic acid-binding Zn-ribbon protein
MKRNIIDEQSKQLQEAGDKNEELKHYFIGAMDSLNQHNNKVKDGMMEKKNELNQNHEQLKQSILNSEDIIQRNIVNGDEKTIEYCKNLKDTLLNSDHLTHRHNNLRQELLSNDNKIRQEMLDNNIELRKICEQLKNGLNEINSKGIQFGSGLNKTSSGELVSSIFDKFNKISDQIKTENYEIILQVTKLIEQFKLNIATENSEQTKKAFDETNGKLTSIISNIDINIKKIINDVKQEMQTNVDKLKNDISNQEIALKKLIDQQLKNIVDGDNQTKQFITETINNIQQGLTPLKDDVKKLQSTISDINLLKQTISIVKDEKDNAIKEINKNISIAKDEKDNAVKEINKNISTIKEENNAMINEIKQNISSVDTKISKDLATIANKCDNNLLLVNSNMTKNIISIHDQVEEKFNNTKSELVAVNEQFNQNNEQIKQTVSSISDYIKQLNFEISSSVSAIDNKFSTQTQKLTEQLDALKLENTNLNIQIETIKGQIKAIILDVYNCVKYTKTEPPPQLITGCTIFNNGTFATMAIRDNVSVRLLDICGQK